MKSRFRSLLVIAFALLAAPSLLAELNTARIDEITGLKGKLNEAEGVYKVSQPRDDVKVSVDGWPMPPFMGLTSWAAFTAGKKEAAMVMGDLVLFQDEVNPVMSAGLKPGSASPRCTTTSSSTTRKSTSCTSPAKAKSRSSRRA